MYIISDLKRVAAVLPFFLLFQATGHTQETRNNSVYFGLGGTVHSYFHESSLNIQSEKGYLSSSLVSPTLSLGYRNYDLFSEIEISTYFNFVPATDTLRDILYIKRNYSFTYFFLYKDFKVGASYVINNNRHEVRNFSLSTNPNIEDGIGFNFGYERGGLSFEVRKEIFFGFGDFVTYTAPLSENWSFRVTRNFDLSRKASGNGKSESENEIYLSFLIGGLANLNPVYEIFPAQEQVKTSLLFGFDLNFKSIDYALYGIRSVWYPIEPFAFTFKLNSQTTSLGMAKTFKQKQNWLSRLSFGLHHTWLSERSLLYLDFLEKGYELSTLPNNFQNRAVGTAIRYSIVKNVDAIVLCDIFYKAHPLLGAGLNDESIRLGLSYSIR